MTNGLTKGRTTIFKNNGSVAFQGFNDKIMNCGKIFLYYRIGNTYAIANDFRVNFEVTEESLNHFAENYNY